MTNGQLWLIVVALALVSQSAVYAADAPAPPPTPQPTEPLLGDVRVSTLKAYTYVFASAETTLNTLQDAIGQLMPKMDAAIDAGQIRPMGPVIFTYHGAGTDRNKKFTLDVGVMAADGAKAPDGMKVMNVPAAQSATMLYTGPVKTLGSAFGKIFAEIGKQNLAPADVFREAYLYWEDPDSQNNVIQIQVEIAPSI